jgi:hypothetical protein
LTDGNGVFSPGLPIGMNHRDRSARVERTRIASTCDDRAHVPVWPRTVRPVDAAPILLRWVFQDISPHREDHLVPDRANA